MQNIKDRLAKLKQEFSQAQTKLNLADDHQELKKQEAEMAKPDFWKDTDKAKTLSQQAATLKRRLEPWDKLSGGLDEISELAAMEDGSMNQELTKLLNDSESRFAELKHQLRFSGPYDSKNVIMYIFAGAGGTDAQDWTQMLLRMYSRWAEASGLKIELIEQSSGEEAGIKSVAIRISGGDYLYGQLKGEHGVHRLVRLSPFNSSGTRETSFARVDVLPEINQPSEAEIDESLLKIDVFRAGGRGGQSVNTTDSAVRITHLPTGISVAIQNERSQLQNKQTAMTIIRSRLAQLQLEQHQESIADIKGPSKSAEWGSQIRSYVLQPYKQVKDLRSGYESSEVESVLDGDIKKLIEAFLDSSIEIPPSKH